MLVIKYIPLIIRRIEIVFLGNISFSEKKIAPIIIEEIAFTAIFNAAKSVAPVFPVIN